MTTTTLSASTVIAVSEPVFTGRSDSPWLGSWPVTPA